MKITIVAGARPNFMKIAPITRAIDAARAQGRSISYRLVYTGKREDTSLDASLFADLHMKEPDVFLEVTDSNATQLASCIMVAFDKELTENPAHIVLVVDDLTATMSCAIVAKKQGIKVAHLVAGTRSFDMNMPKEVNRMITDGLSVYYGGDTGYSSHFSEIQELFGAPDYALLGIGAYKPRWFMQANLISPYDSLTAASQMKARITIPMHYGTFDLSDEPLSDPPAVFAEEAGKRNIQVKIPALGEIVKLLKR